MKGNDIMIVRKEIDISKPLTKEEIESLHDFINSPPIPDEDCPFLSDEELERFHRVSEKNRIDRKKPSVTIRISPKAYDTAKSLGKGYTSVLARMLESDLSDKKRIQQFL